jgi:hypothetical protein
VPRIAPLTERPIAGMPRNLIASPAAVATEVGWVWTMMGWRAGWSLRRCGRSLAWSRLVRWAILVAVIAIARGCWLRRGRLGVGSFRDARRVEVPSEVRRLSLLPGR